MRGVKRIRINARENEKKKKAKPISTKRQSKKKMEKCAGEIQIVILDQMSPGSAQAAV